MNASVLKEFLFCPNDLTAFWTYDVNNRRSSSTYNERGDAQTSTYQANNLNQYISRTTPGYAAVRGEASPDATVTVNGNPTFRLGAFYLAQSPETFAYDGISLGTSGAFFDLLLSFKEREA